MWLVEADCEEEGLGIVVVAQKVFGRLGGLDVGQGAFGLQLHLDGAQNVHADSSFVVWTHLAERVLNC
jgi:hypothetical protein